MLGVFMWVRLSTTGSTAVSSHRPLNADLAFAPPRSASVEASASKDSSAHRLALARRCLALAETAPLAAMEMAITENLCTEDAGLLTSLLSQWAKRDFDGAYAWTKTQEPGPWRDNQLAHLAYLCALTDPVAATRIVATDISPGPARDEAVISVVHQWALRAPEAASTWVRSIPDGPLRQRADNELTATQNRSG